MNTPFFVSRKSLLMQRGISVKRVCLFLVHRGKGEKKMNTGLIAIFILLVIIVGAIATRRCVEFLIGGSLVAAIFMYRKDFLPQWCTLIQDVLAENVWIVLVCGLFGSLSHFFRSRRVLLVSRNWFQNSVTRRGKLFLLLLLWVS